MAIIQKQFDEGNFITLREMCPYSEFFWPVFSRIRTEYGEIRSISPHSVRLRENTDQKKLHKVTRKTPYLDTFHAVLMLMITNHLHDLVIVKFQAQSLEGESLEILLNYF